MTDELHQAESSACDSWEAVDAKIHALEWLNVDVVALAEQVVNAAENRRVCGLIKSALRRAPRIAETVSNQVQGGTVRLAPRALVSQPTLNAALNEITAATCTWEWAYTGSVCLVVAMLEFPTAEPLNLVFGWKKYQWFLHNVVDAGRLWLTADADETAPLHLLPVDGDALATVLNSFIPYA